MSNDIIASDSEDSFYQQHFTGLSYDEKRLESKEFDGCRFERCKLTNSVLDRCTFLDCAFDGCLLSPIQFWNCSFLDTSFTDCKLIGVDWTQVSEARGISFTECILNYSTFSSMKLKGLKMLRCTCKEVDFSEADLTNSDFEGTDFEKSVFAQTNLTGANFAGARHYWIDPRSNIVKKARFALPDALALLKVLDIIVE